MTARGRTDHRKIQLYLAPTPVPPLTNPLEHARSGQQCQQGLCRIFVRTRGLGELDILDIADTLGESELLSAFIIDLHPSHEPLPSPPLPSPTNRDRLRWRHPRGLAPRRNVGLPVDGVPPVDSRGSHRTGSGPMFTTKEGPGRADHRPPKIVRGRGMMHHPSSVKQMRQPLLPSSNSRNPHGSLACHLQPYRSAPGGPEDSHRPPAA